jgi:hypothetical protein
MTTLPLSPQNHYKFCVQYYYRRKERAQQLAFIQKHTLNAKL